MKKSILISYFQGVQDTTQGQDYARITAYFVPEFITAVVLYSVPLLIDAHMIACLKSTPAYATLGVTNTLLHFIVKIAEALSVGTIVLTGQYNGMQDFKKAGSVLINAFWSTVIVGAVIAGGLFFGAHAIYYWYGVPDQMIELGIPFLQLRAVGIFFTFVYFAFIGFLRGVKNTQIPMITFVVGSVVFLFFDYVLIFGKCGFPELQLQGSAWATVIQYGFMCAASILYVLFSPEMKRYAINLFSYFTSLEQVKQLFGLSWPVVIDKGALAASYLWLGKCLAPMGTCVIASFAVIKDLERFGLLPAIAFAQVITFLVSNDLGKQDWNGIKVTLKKILLLSSIMTLSVLFFCSLFPTAVIRVFDIKGEFTDFAAYIFPFMSALAFFDVVQLILAGALRGAANVKMVMWTRLIVCGGVFMPLSYYFSQLPMTNQTLKFMLIYGSLYLGNAIMGAIYIKRFRNQEWIKQALRNSA